jgi:ASCH domain
MKCLSVRQPWAWAIVSGVKAIENRSWSTQHRGPLAIHAGLTKDEFRGRDFAETMPGLPAVEDLTFGAIIGVVDVIDCVPFAAVKDQPFAEPLGQCWLLANPRPLADPIPFSGRQGLFDVDLDPAVLEPRPAPDAPASPSDDVADLAELRAFRARLRTGGFPEPDVEAKRRAKAELVARGISPKWASFVATFGFGGDVAEAMLRVLESPGRCHAGWFLEAMIAVRRSGLDSGTLTYPAIRDAIEAWRAERKAACPVEVG